MMPVISFYAYKGGTGRTLAAVHSAWQLAREGRRVLLMDLDLSAPSIWPLVVQRPPEAGFVELAAEWIGGRYPDVRSYVHRVPLDVKAKGELFVMSAGRMDGSYLERLQELDWKTLADPRSFARPGDQLPLTGLGEHGEMSFFDYLRGNLQASVDPDAIFVDAPTGLSDTSNICLRVLATSVVVLFAPTRVQLEGVGRVVSLLTEEGRDAFCVASTLMTRRATGATMTRVARAFDYLEKVRHQALGSPDLQDEETLERVEQQPAAITYSPALADLEQVDTTVEPAPEETAVYEELLDRLRQGVPEPRKEELPVLPRDLKVEVLGKLEPLFKQIADAEEGLEQYFLRKPHLDRVREQKYVLILGGKGSGKTALFSYSLGQHEDKVTKVAVHGVPDGTLQPDQLLALARGGAAMDIVWRAYALLRSDKAIERPTAQRAVTALRALIDRRGSVADALSALDAPQLGVDVDAEWVQVESALQAAGEQLVLYMDGLDTAFKDDLSARRRSLESLFIAWQATFARLHHVSLKVFLRGDLWERLSFPEQSHLSLRRMDLTWDDENLWRLVLKRALSERSFVKICEQAHIHPMLTHENVEVSSAEALYTHLDVLIEKRIWTGKNSLSRSWILRRLKDARGTIFPRDVLCLIHQAMQQESVRIRNDQRSAPEAILSRESLSKALPPTSAQRVAAVREEYPELVEILRHVGGLPAKGALRDLRRRLPDATTQPVDPIDALVGAGVLGIDSPKRTVENAWPDDSKYDVPALYLHGLGMVRPGPT